MADDGRLDARALAGRAPQHGKAPFEGRHRKLSKPFTVDGLSMPRHAAGHAEEGAEAVAAAKHLAAVSDTANTSHHTLDFTPARDHNEVAPETGTIETMSPERTRDSLGDDSRRGWGWRFFRDLIVVAALALLISIAVKAFLVRPYYIPSASMHHTLIEQDRVLVNLLAPNAVPLSRGDIVVFHDPGGWLPQTPPKRKDAPRAIVDGALETVGLKPEETDDTLIKRVIGLPGDHVVCCNAYGQLVINDVGISEPYAVLGGNKLASGMQFDVTVPADSYWVMGDNRYNSQDSRFHQDLPTRGFVSKHNVIGRAFMINLPVNRITILGNYPEVFATVPTRNPTTP